MLSRGTVGEVKFYFVVFLGLSRSVCCLPLFQMERQPKEDKRYSGYLEGRDEQGARHTVRFNGEYRLPRNFGRLSSA